jgi:hypothetical protein
VLPATTGVTQVDLAKLLGVAGRTVRRWMEGACAPPAIAGGLCEGEWALPHLVREARPPRRRPRAISSALFVLRA